MNSPLRIVYAAAVRLPTEKAHGAQIMQTCKALVDGGAAIELVIPGRDSAVKKDPFIYYNIEKKFAITTLAVPDWFASGRVGFFISSFLFGLKVVRYAKHSAPSHVYSRDKTTLFAIALFAPQQNLVWEVHMEESGFITRYLAHRVRFVTISEGLKTILTSQGVPPTRVCVAPDGVALEAFSHAESQEAARLRLGLPQDKKIAMYIGRLDGWKGVDTLLEASLLLPSDILLVIVGGEPSQVTHFKMRYPRVLFLGFLPYADIADNEAAANVLVLPNTATDVTSMRYTSPLKLFTYMAAGKPIVASDLPSIREVLTDESCYFVKPDSPTALAKGIADASSLSSAIQKAASAQALVTLYTWDSRVQKITSFLTS